jgi:tetratricopeptide (TPR) repeat protein
MLNVLRDGELMASTNQHVVWTMAFQLQRAWLYKQTTSWAQGCALAEQARAQALRTGHHYGQLLSLVLLGWVHLGLGASQRAFHYFSEMTHQKGHVLMDLLVRLLRHQGLSEYWLAEGEYGNARREARQLCELAAQPGERTYLAFGRRILAEVALAERQWGEAEEEISRALVVLEGVDAPLAEWQVYATAAQLHQQRGRTAEAGRCWSRSATVLNRLANSLGDSDASRQSLLAHPFVCAILSQAQSL